MKRYHLFGAPTEKELKELEETQRAEEIERLKKKGTIAFMKEYNAKKRSGALKIFIANKVGSVEIGKSPYSSSDIAALTILTAGPLAIVAAVCIPIVVAGNNKAQVFYNGVCEDFMQEISEKVDLGKDARLSFVQIAKTEVPDQNILVLDFTVSKDGSVYVARTKMLINDEEAQYLKNNLKVFESDDENTDVSKKPKKNGDATKKCVKNSFNEIAVIINSQEGDLVFTLTSELPNNIKKA